jgi:hypothetical protein
MVSVTVCEKNGCLVEAKLYYPVQQSGGFFGGVYDKRLVAAGFVDQVGVYLQ